MKQVKHVDKLKQRLQENRHMYNIHPEYGTVSVDVHNIDASKQILTAIGRFFEACREQENGTSKT